MIVDLHHRPRIGPYILTRELGPTMGFGLVSCTFHDVSTERPSLLGNTAASSRPQPERFLALHENNQTSHVAYRFAPMRGKAEEARLVAAVESASLLDHPHALRIEQFTFDMAGHGWVITPYPGDADGIRTLGRLLREKGGQMRPIEAERAMSQLLSVVAMAQGGSSLQPPMNGDGSMPPRAAPCHGPLSMNQILVDRRGSLLVELYGLARALEQVGRPSLESMRDEVRSVVEIGYELVTGLRAEHPLIPASRLVRNLDARWDRWLMRGLDPSGGFDSAEAALCALTLDQIAVRSSMEPAVGR